MPVRCTEHQDLVGEKDERGKALSANAHFHAFHIFLHLREPPKGLT